MTWFDAPQPLLPEIIALNSKWKANKAALIAGDQVVSWRELGERLNRIANGLHAAGLQRGDRVAVLMGNLGETVEAIFGIVNAGCVAVPLNLAVGQASLEAMLDNAEVKAAFASGEHGARIRQALAKVPSLRAEALFGVDCGAGWQPFAEWRDAQSSAAPQVTIEDEDECNIIYSSGTTGVPKGIVHTHRRRLGWGYDIALQLRYDSGAVALVCLGLYSNISWVAMLSVLICGGTLVVAEGFSPARCQALIEQHGCTHMTMVPLTYQRLVQDPGFNADALRTLKAVMCCGSPLPEPIKREILQKLPCQFIELYGLTEGVITTLDPEDVGRKLNSVGKPMIGTDIRIIGEDDRECPVGVPGEIVSRGRITMAGYHRRQDANEESTWLDEQGRRWLRTGDVGQLDEEGFLYLVDRKKDMIISGGQNIYPADIEAVLCGHPQVAECAVIGVPHDQWGETPLAVVVPREGAQSGEITQWLNERVGKWQRVMGTTLVNTLPRNPNGKITKGDLRKDYKEGRLTLVG